jgi:hypothetical protein
MHAPQCKPTYVGSNFATWVAQPHSVRSAVAAPIGLADTTSSADGRQATATPPTLADAETRRARSLAPRFVGLMCRAAAESDRALAPV